ncbi:MAG: aminotransferase class V-fold PLP-dependent enzyme [Eubacteriales bacterium]|nr:aminotransferase class V-fold PLP-dependent enzyme [Eubacteriales bacterium]
MDKKQIYMDYAATAPLKKEVLDAMMPYLTENFGNASSPHAFGRAADAGVEAARKQLTDALGAHNGRVYITSGGTEADNWALKGYAHRNARKGKHIIISAVEHHAILHTAQMLEKEGFAVSFLPVDGMCMTHPEKLKELLRPDTILVSVMTANNEVGTIQPIEELAKVTHENSSAVFHTDAVQAVGNVAIDADAMGIDMLSLSAHKFYGPKGIGALYVKKGVVLDNLIDGGAQEWGHRAGTYNAASIVGMGKAIELATQNLPEHVAKVTALRDELISRVLTIKDSQLNGHPTQRLAGNANFSFAGIEGEGLLLVLDLAGIAASSGSACSSGSLEPSHVLTAMGLEPKYLHSTIRFSLGDGTTREDVEYAAEQIRIAVEKLRALSPIYN